MAALSQKRVPIEERARVVALPMAAVKVYQGGIACWDTANGVVTNGKASTTLIKIGEWEVSYDNSGGVSGGAQVLVDLDTEFMLRWYDNDPGGGALVAANIGTMVYILDDHTVTSTSAGNSFAGRLWKLNSIKGAAIQSMGFTATGLA